MDFPEEIIRDLLLRLPVKSVMRLNCVSKGWNDMITNPAFRKDYLSRHSENAPTGFFYHHKRPEFLERGPCMPVMGPAKFIGTSTNIVKREELNCLDYLHDLGYVLASSKGLLLLSRNPMSYHVYDLVSKKHIKLPKTLKKYPYVAVGFICHEQETDRSRLSYKVVRIGGKPIEMIGYAKTRRVETFSSEIGKWQKSTMSAASEFRLWPQDVAKVIGGVFHWHEHGGRRTVAYNPDDPEGRVKLIELPWDRDDDIYGLGGIEGTQNKKWLQFFLVHESIKVWILKGKQEGGSYLDDEDVVETSRWTFTHTISFLELGVRPSYFGPKIGDTFPYPIGISPWNPNIIFLRTMNEIMSFDQNDQKIEIVSSYHIEEWPVWPSAFVPFQWPVWPCL